MPVSMLLLSPLNLFSLMDPGPESRALYKCPRVADQARQKRMKVLCRRCTSQDLPAAAWQAAAEGMEDHGCSLPPAETIQESRCRLVEPASISLEKVESGTSLVFCLVFHLMLLGTRYYPTYSYSKLGLTSLVSTRQTLSHPFLGRTDQAQSVRPVLGIHGAKQKPFHGEIHFVRLTDHSTLCRAASPSYLWLRLRSTFSGLSEHDAQNRTHSISVEGYRLQASTTYHFHTICSKSD